MAFDLFVATWIARDGLHRGISQFILIPILGVTFMFGPIGLLAYLLAWAFSQKRVAALSAWGQLRADRHKITGGAVAQKLP